VITFATEVNEAIPLTDVSDIQSRAIGGVLREESGGKKTAGRLNRDGWASQYDPAFRHRALFDAIVLAVARPPEAGRRHLVLVFSAGGDTASALMEGALLREIAVRSEALLHVAFWNRRRSSWQLEGLHNLYGRLTATAAATATGGRAHDAANAVEAFRNIVTEFRQSYVLRYTLRGVAMAGWHDIYVTIPDKPEYDVSARRGYMGR
jgi:hypothetical protein